ncbi:MAG: putative metal-dependent hydrolase [Bacteroidota bacterium]|nr:putative metal-dependent hydrolase [Bacteroidota bacterium]
MIQNAELEKLKFPIGKFAPPANYTAQLLQTFKESIKNFPQKLRAETAHLNDQQLDTPYRPNGWTIRQAIHHCADSHMNGFTRLKLALTENKPTIKPYDQNGFANLSDSKMPIDVSLNILEGLHARWYNVVCNLKESDLERKYIHPEYGKEVPMKEFIAQYAWHGATHLGHITSLKERMGWK